MGTNVQFALGRLAGALATIRKFRTALIGIPNCDHIVGTWDDFQSESAHVPGTMARLSELPPGRGHLELDYEFEHCPDCGKYLD